MALLPQIQYPDLVGDGMSAYSLGYGQADDMRKRNLLLEAGRLMASGGGGAPSAASSAVGGAGNGIGAYSNAISSIESGGRYDAVGPATRSGDRAYGKYQVMGANIPAWTQKHLGREMTPQQFLADKDAQEKVFSGEFGGYVAKYGNPQDAASMWFSGRPAAQGAGRNDGYTSQPEYLRRFNTALGGGQASAPASAGAPAQGGMQAASNALLRGGELQAGLGLQDKMRARSQEEEERGLARQKEMWGIVGDLALAADTPEKWARAIETAQRGGMNVQGMEDFSARDLVLARSGRMKAALDAAKPDYMTAGKRVFNKVTGQYVPLDPNSPAEPESLSKQPTWVQDASGNWQIAQLNESGDPRIAKFPEGIKLMPPSFTVDTGTGSQILSRPGGQVMGGVTKDVAGEAAQKQIGEAAGQAVVDLPRQVGNASEALKVIKQLREHPGRAFATGGSAVVPGIPGTQQRDFIAILNQAKGKAFLEAFNSLKGGGAITEKEGEKATEAIARLDRAQTEEGFLTSLKDLEEVVNAGLARAKQKAGTGAAPVTTPSARPRATNPQTGAVVEYNEQSGQWEAAQ
jgi:hypothetical protein